MAPDTPIALRPGVPADIPRLVVVWRSSVDATHGFVRREDLDYFEGKMANVYLPGVELTVGEVDGRVVGFSGIHQRELALLFIDAGYRGRGVGSALLRDALARVPGLVVDVNEQNLQAIGFYQHHGFRVVGRSPVDGTGKPYPILHMAQQDETGQDTPGGAVSQA